MEKAAYEERKCPVCEAPIRGRLDKIYCSPNCKSAQQYEDRKKVEQTYFAVDRQLKQNRKILKKYNQTGMTTLRREVLHQEGFNPKYFTHYWKNKKGDVYLFTYDFGILKLNEENGKKKYLIVEWQDSYMSPSN
ncbi:MAG: hypothetical protein RIC95_00310 [Vicingaceae bacterium]